MNSAPQSKRAAWLYLLASAVIAAAAFPALDYTVDRALSVAGNPGWIWLATLCSELGEGWVVVAGLLATLLFLAYRRPRLAANIFFVALTSAMTGLAGMILRVLIGRTRPSASVAQGFYGIWHGGQWILGKVEFSSFPSGHAATAAGLAAAVWLVDRRWGLLASVYALAVMWSRVALGWHHLSDVAAGAVVGIIGAVLMKNYFALAIEKMFAGRPALSGGAGRLADDPSLP